MKDFAMIRLDLNYLKKAIQQAGQDECEAGSARSADLSVGGGLGHPQKKKLFGLRSPGDRLEKAAFGNISAARKK
jgi:hypothetical protein